MRSSRTGNPAEKTGLPARGDEHVPPAGGRPLSTAWVSDDLLARTRRVWSNAYGRPVGTEEAAEILTNVKHLAEALARAKYGGDGP